MEDNIEIIEFVRPHENEKNLYVRNISNRLTEQTVNTKLFQIFSQFGLLHEVQVLGCSTQPLTLQGHDITDHVSNATAVSCNQSSRGSLYAFVKFYSSKAAKDAMSTINGKYMLDGQLLRVRFANRQKPVETSAQLVYQKCCELANHYLGFNGWSSQIVTLEEDKDSCEPNFARFIAVTRIDIRQHNMHSEGIGVGEIDYTPTEPMSKLTAYHRSKKIAVHRAIEGAFSKVLLVVLPNGKVAPDVNCTSVDALHYVTQQESKGIVEVKQMNNDEEADIEGALADDTGNLDDINAQLLLDMQMGM